MCAQHRSHTCTHDRHTSRHQPPLPWSSHHMLTTSYTAAHQRTRTARRDQTIEAIVECQTFGHRKRWQLGLETRQFLLLFVQLCPQTEQQKTRAGRVIETRKGSQTRHNGRKKKEEGEEKEDEDTHASQVNDSRRCFQLLRITHHNTHAQTHTHTQKESIA